MNKFYLFIINCQISIAFFMKPLILSQLSDMGKWKQRDRDRGTIKQTDKCAIRERYNEIERLNDRKRDYRDR